MNHLNKIKTEKTNEIFYAVAMYAMTAIVLLSVLVIPIMWVIDLNRALS